MEEELNENELEEKFYSMIHHVDETQVNTDGKEDNNDSLHLLVSVPRSTIRRYWRTSGDNNTFHQKINSSIDSTVNNKNVELTPQQKTKSKESKGDAVLASDLSFFQSPIPQNVKKTIEILENDETNIVELESSDEDEVIEVALPPKPTITIESSDEEISPPIQTHSPIKQASTELKQNKSVVGEGRESASPVPSIVSSVSDEFIRSDCIALKISSRHPDNPSFDFSLHGADLIDHNTPAKKKKRKRTKERATSTPVAPEASSKISCNKINDECFATPKSKAKNKRQRTKSYQVTEKSVPNPDVYDSDSNHSTDIAKNTNSHVVTDGAFPNIDIYESDSSQSETIKDTNTSVQQKPNNVISIPNNTSMSQADVSKKLDNVVNTNKSISIYDRSDDPIAVEETTIDENIVMGNVTGFEQSEEDYEDHSVNEDSIPKLGSTNVPSILYEDLDFDNLKGNSDKVCRRRKFSITTLRAEMEKFYNESWGGENFNHREIQKYMSRDKSLWAIDPKDRMPSYYKKKVTCNYCNRTGHRDETCRFKPPICFMCGDSGHFEPRCPRKICVNCGSPNYMYSSVCRNCSSWNRLTCAECGQRGHPASHCPDVWRRYHNTVDVDKPLEENRQTKKNYQQFCSGCTRRGHLVHTCRISLPFSGFPINSPYVVLYRPVYLPSDTNNQQNYSNNKLSKSFQDTTVSSGGTIPLTNIRNKRRSTSPTAHESHMNKRRNVSMPDMIIKSPQRKTSQGKETIVDIDNSDNPTKELNKDTETTEKAPDFIPIISTNHDKRGQMIQDNQVSDTSDVVTSARIYVTNEILNKLKTEDGTTWLKEMTDKHNVSVQHTDLNSFLSVTGKIGDQEAFQTDLRDWATEKHEPDMKSDNVIDITKETEDDITASNNIPKNRNNLLRKLGKAFESLKQDLGDPNAILKEVKYLQNHQKQLQQQKVISPQKVSNNRCNINNMFKKLNMVLIGQAGLADGFRHLRELYSLQERITNLRQKNIPLELRQEIGQHYHTIFTASPRNDYRQLLRRYYRSVYYLKNRNSKAHFKKHIKSSQSFQKHNKSETADKINPETNFMSNIHIQRKQNAEKIIYKLVSYHKRIIHARPLDTVLKKTRVELVRRLHTHIASLGNRSKVSSKNLKKMKKIEKQAQLFLTNV